MSNPTPIATAVVAAVAAAVEPTKEKQFSRRTIQEVMVAIVKANGTKTNAEIAAELNMSPTSFGQAKVKAKKLVKNLPPCKSDATGRGSVDVIAELNAALAGLGVDFTPEVAETPETPEVPESTETVEAPAVAE